MLVDGTCVAAATWLPRTATGADALKHSLRQIQNGAQDIV